jgi:PadR family transcriptional regulator PadR
MDVAEVVQRDPQLLKGVLPMLVLTLLEQEESYGYELVIRLQEAGLSGIASGTVYPVLTRLEREGRLTSRLVPSAAGPARKYYRPTASGLGLLADARRAWASLSDVVHRLLPSTKEPR